MKEFSRAECLDKALGFFDYISIQDDIRSRVFAPKLERWIDTMILVMAWRLGAKQVEVLRQEIEQAARSAVTPDAQEIFKPLLHAVRLMETWTAGRDDKPTYKAFLDELDRFYKEEAA